VCTLNLMSVLCIPRLCGSYGAMDGGNLCDALVDFTSGLSEMINMKEEDYKNNEEKREKLRKQLLKKHDQHALMCCAISVWILIKRWKMPVMKRILNCHLNKLSLCSQQIRPNSKPGLKQVSLWDMLMESLLSKILI